MIISASYRTDIPAFYGEWFRNRFRAGWCKVVNPYGRQIQTVPLREGVDGFVFWTRNAAPFAPALADLRQADIPFVVQYTVTGLPRALESSVTAAESAVTAMRELARTYGPRAVVWRYDPILISSLTPPDWHRETFRRLAAALEGATDEVVISFAQIYRKTERNLTQAARVHGFTWNSPPDEEKRALAEDLAAVARRHGMGLTLCTQPDLASESLLPARCIDAARLSDVAGRPIPARTKGNRPGCLCAESRDIGAYDTCPHGCAYCYAVQNRDLAKTGYHGHDPEGEFLFPRPAAAKKTPTLFDAARSRNND